MHKNIKCPNQNLGSIKAGRFPRNHRLTTKADFKSLFDRSQKVNQKYLLALYQPNKKNYARLGIIVGKRVASSAIVRNKIKRVIRESFRVHQATLKGLDIIVIARQQNGTLNKTILREGIDKLWLRLLTQYQNVLS